MIKTNRLVLRAFQETDVDFLYALDNNKLVNIYRSRDTCTMEYCLGQIHNWSYLFADAFLNVYLITLKYTNEPIGLIFLVRKANGRVELGYRLLDTYWGNGYCTEAATALLKHYYERGERDTIYAETHGDNTASIGLLHKLGFIETAYDMENNCRVFELEYRQNKILE